MNLLNLIPEINRARNYHFYTPCGKRYLDMWQENGGAILGHRQKKYAIALKNNIDRGIFSPLPSKYKHQMRQALRGLLGNKNFYLFKSFESAANALTENNIAFSLWRPLETDFHNPETFISILPMPGGLAPGVVVSDKILDIEEETVCPVILCGAVRCVWNLKEFRENVNYSIWQNSDFSDVASKYFDVKIPYLFPVIDEQQYEILFKKCLEHNIVISPFYDKPSVLVPEISHGELMKLLEVLSN